MTHPSPAKSSLALPVQLLRKKNWISWWSVKGEGERVRLPGGDTTKKPLVIQPKLHKLPINPRTGNYACVDQADTWGTLQEATAGVQRWGVSGLGFVFTLELGIIFTDLDDCRTPDSGEIAPWALQIVRDLDTYTEVSPNGTGLHLLAYGEKPGGLCKKKYESGLVEMYATGHYSTMTSQHLDGTPCNIEVRPDEITALYHKVFGEPKAPVLNRQQQTVNIDDEALLAKIRTSAQAPKFDRLWDGDTAEYGGDESSADLGLCCMLAFWTGGDTARIDSLFRQSELMREKWDEQRGALTYGAKTIEKALECQTEFYSPRRVDGSQQPANGNHARLQTAAEEAGSEDGPLNTEEPQLTDRTEEQAGANPAPDNSWRDRLLRGKPRPNGEPGSILVNLANAVTGLSSPEWEGVFAWNSFAVRVETKWQTPFGNRLVKSGATAIRPELPYGCSRTASTLIQTSPARP